MIHQAATDDKQFSTHVTISVYQHNAWANFLEVALPRVIRRAFDSDVEFRRGLPVGYLEYMGSQFPSDSEKARAFAKTIKSLVGKLTENVDDNDLQLAADEAAMDFIANRLPPVDADSSEESVKLSPLDDGAAVRFKDRSHVRLTMAEDEMKEPYVGVYFSSQNCRTHHMGLCTCRGDGDEGDDDESDDDGSEGGDDENENEGSDNDDGDGGSDEGESAEMLAAMHQVPVPARSIAFPGDLAQPLMKLYASYPAFVSADSLDNDSSAGDAVRAMLVRLWSEGLLDVQKQQ